MEHVDSTISVPKVCLIVDRSKRQILDLAYRMKRPRTRDVTLHPLSRPAPLKHWRVLVALVAGMSSTMRTDFLSLGKEELYRFQGQDVGVSAKSRGPLDRDRPRHPGKNRSKKCGKL